jgi:carboxypeptidase family protein
MLIDGWRIAFSYLAVGTLAVSTLDALCSVPQPRSLCAEYFHSDAVVTASVANIRVVGDSEGHFYSMLTGNTLRGTVPPRFRIWEENSSGRATFNWKPGRTYLLFMRYSGDVRAWNMDGCGNSGPLPQHSGVLKRLRSIPTRPGDALVEGLASLRETSIDPIPNVTITATTRRNGKVFRTATGPNGRFRLRLPPGVYRLKATGHGFDFSKPELLSYEDPRRLNLTAGSCAQVQFTADQ